MIFAAITGPKQRISVSLAAAFLDEFGDLVGQDAAAEPAFDRFWFGDGSIDGVQVAKARARSRAWWNPIGAANGTYAVL